LLNRLLCRFIDLERDVMKGRLWNGRTELLLIRSIGELEERESSAITETEEAVTVGTHLSEEFVGFAPGRHEWQSNDLLVELAGLLHVLGRVGCVMKTAGQVRCFRHPANSPISGRTPARRSRVYRREASLRARSDLTCQPDRRHGRPRSRRGALSRLGSSTPLFSPTFNDPGARTSLIIWRFIGMAIVTPSTASRNTHPSMSGSESVVWLTSMYAAKAEMSVPTRPTR